MAPPLGVSWGQSSLPDSATCALVGPGAEGSQQGVEALHSPATVVVAERHDLGPRREGIADPETAVGARSFPVAADQTHPIWPVPTS